MTPSSSQVMLRICALVITLVGVSTATQAIHVNEALKARQAVAFWGGFTLAHSGSTCPSNTYECIGDNVVNGWDNEYACCPVGTYCWNNDDTYCCPDATDCGNKLGTEQVCADTAWTLWEGVSGHGPFCCQEGETPIADENAPFGECWSAGMPVISTEIASTLPQVAVTFLPFTATGQGAPATNTIAHATSSTSSAPTKTQSVISTVESSAAKINLSKTAIIGIAVGGGIALIILLLAVGCCCWKCCFKKRRRAEPYAQSYEPYRAMEMPS